MANFQPIIKKTLIHEGGYAHNPYDKGGATKYGITQRTLSSWLETQGADTYNVQNITLEHAMEIYRQWYWNAINGDHIRSDKSALVIFDIGVNQGVDRAKRRTQEVLNVLNFHLKVDGLFGPRTLGALNSAPTQTFCRKFLQRSETFYTLICRRDPTQLVFRQGWHTRVFSLQDEVARRGDSVV